VRAGRARPDHRGQPCPGGAAGDIRDTGRFDRAIAAQRAGVREAMAVPVTGAEGVVAVQAGTSALVGDLFASALSA
jgi:hypothetical protein